MLHEYVSRSTINSLRKCFFETLDLQAAAPQGPGPPTEFHSHLPVVFTLTLLHVHHVLLHVLSVVFIILLRFQLRRHGQQERTPTAI